MKAMLSNGTKLLATTVDVNRRRSVMMSMLPFNGIVMTVAPTLQHKHYSSSVILVHLAMCATNLYLVRVCQRQSKSTLV